MGKKDEAGAAIPDELIDMVSLCGPRGRRRATGWRRTATPGSER